MYAYIYVHAHALPCGPTHLWSSRMHLLTSMGHITMPHRAMSAVFPDLLGVWHRGLLVVRYGSPVLSAWAAALELGPAPGVPPQTFAIIYLCSQTTELNSNVASRVPQANHEDSLPREGFRALILPAVEVAPLKPV